MDLSNGRRKTQNQAYLFKTAIKDKIHNQGAGCTPILLRASKIKKVHSLKNGSSAATNLCVMMYPEQNTEQLAVVYNSTTK